MPKAGSVRVFKLDGRGVGRVLGSLETEVMEEVWRQRETTIRRVWEVLRRRRRLSFNTVMTVMNRLATQGVFIRRAAPRPVSSNPVLPVRTRRATKGFPIRRGPAGRYRFQARESREVFLAGVSRAIATGLIKDFGDYAVAQFVAALREVDPAKLEALRQTVAETQIGSSARKPSAR